MTAWSKIENIWRRKKREFTNKRGRMGRSPFFANLCLVFAFILVYILALYGFVNGLDQLELPRPFYNNLYYLGVGVLFLLLAFGTRPLRLKRLRDMGLPVWSDLPFMVLLISSGISPLFHFFNLPYLRNLHAVNMPENLRDLLGVLWLIWMLVLVLAPSKHRANIFTCQAKLDERP